MPGARYTDWTHVHVVGDRDAAQAYVPYARKVLGYVSDEAKARGYQTHKMTKRLEDGAVVIGEVRGGIPRVTIQPPVGKVVTDTPAFGDFVVWARSADLPDGIDPEYPEQILKAAERDGEPVRWRAYKKDGDIDPGAAAGFYGARFPDGLTFNGNLDWRGPDDERLSWYGPVLRYWCDRFRQPSALYGRWVFLLGLKLLDIDSYCTDADVDIEERKVLGACLRGGWLYVMQANIDDMPTGAPVGQPGDVYISPPFYAGITNLRLMRYRVLVDPAIEDPSRYSIELGSHESLWTNTAALTVNPWFFSPDGTTCVTTVMPNAPHAHQYYNGTDYDYEGPAANHQHVVLSIDDDQAVTLVATAVGLAVYQTTSTECTVAADFDQDGNPLQMTLGYEPFATPGPLGEFVYPAYQQPWANYYLVLDGYRIELYTANAGQSRGELLAVDLRARAAVVRRHTVSADGTTMEVELEYHCDGELQRRVPVGSVPAPGGIFEDDKLPLITPWQYLCVAKSQATVSPLCLLLGAQFYGSVDSTPFSAPSYLSSGVTCTYGEHSSDDVYGLTAYYDDTGTGLYGEVLLSFYSDQYTDAPFCNASDALGKKNPLGMAANDGVLIYSGPAWDTDAAGHYATDGALPAITGVAAGDATRFHPCWLLGKPPIRSIP